MVRHWLRHTPTYRSFALRSTQSALTSSILMRFFPSHPTPFGCLYIRYNLLDLIDRINYTIKTKFLNLFIPMPSIVDISPVRYMNTTAGYLIYKILQLLFRDTIQNLCHPEYQLPTNYTFGKTIIFLFGIADFVNLLTCSDNYIPASYPNTKAKDADEFVPTWMFAEPTFDGLRLSLFESTRLVAQREKPARRSEHIGHIYLKNDTIDIDVHLTEGLNVVIGGSSSGKTLFVDSIYRAIKQNFDKSNYTAFRVKEISVDNPSNMHPYYVSQSFIADNINTNKERSIDKIEILHNIFPTDDEINQQITDALNELNITISEMIQCVSTIEKTSLALNAIPHIGRLVIKGKSKQNAIKLLLPDNDTTKLV